MIFRPHFNHLRRKRESCRYKILPKDLTNSANTPLPLLALDILLGHQHEVTSVYWPRPTNQTGMWVCRSLRMCTCTVHVPISFPLQTDYTLLLLQREKNYLCMCVSVCVCVRLRVYPARPVMSGLSGDRLINVWMFSSYLAQSLHTECTHSRGTGREGWKGEWIRERKVKKRATGWQRRDGEQCFKKMEYSRSLWNSICFY